jgi:hypothetical protein
MVISSILFFRVQRGIVARDDRLAGVLARLAAACRRLAGVGTIGDGGGDLFGSVRTRFGAPGERVEMQQFGEVAPLGQL